LREERAVEVSKKVKTIGERRGKKEPPDQMARLTVRHPFPLLRREPVRAPLACPAWYESQPNKGKKKKGLEGTDPKRGEKKYGKHLTRPRLTP